MALLGHPVLGDQQYSYGYAKQVARSLQPFPGQTPRTIAIARLGRDAEMGAGRWWAAVEEDGDALPARIRAAKAAEAAAPAAAERRRADSEADAAYGASGERGAGQSVRQRVRDMLRGEGAGSDGWSDEGEPFTYPSGLTAAQLDPDPDAFSGTTAVQRLRNDRSSRLRSAAPRPAPAPAAGDARAAAPAGAAPAPAPGLCLWAVGIAFSHPFTGELVALDLPEPPSFQVARACELQSWGARELEQRWLNREL